VKVSNLVKAKEGKIYCLSRGSTNKWGNTLLNISCRRE